MNVGFGQDPEHYGETYNEYLIRIGVNIPRWPLDSTDPIGETDPAMQWEARDE